VRGLYYKHKGYLQAQARRQSLLYITSTLPNSRSRQGTFHRNPQACPLDLWPPEDSASDCDCDCDGNLAYEKRFAARNDPHSFRSRLEPLFHPSHLVHYFEYVHLPIEPYIHQKSLHIIQ